MPLTFEQFVEKYKLGITDNDSKYKDRVTEVFAELDKLEPKVEVEKAKEEQGQGQAKEEQGQEKEEPIFLQFDEPKVEEPKVERKEAQIEEIMEALLEEKLEKQEKIIEQIKKSEEEIIERRKQIFSMYTNTENDVVLNFIGLYYKNYLDDKDTSDKFFTSALKKGSEHALGNLKFDDVDAKLKYCLEFIEQGHHSPFVYMFLGNIYNRNSENEVTKWTDLEFAEKYYLLALEHNIYNNNKIFDIYETLTHMYRIQYRYSLQKKYFVLAAERNNSFYENICSYFNSSDNNKKTVKELILSALDKDKINILSVINIYKKFGFDIKELIYNYSDKLNQLDNIDVPLLQSILGTSLQLYNFLSKINKPSEPIKKVLFDLKNDYKVLCFANKLNKFAIQDECPICLEHATVIPKECCHYYCCDCYIKYDVCAICNKS